VAARGVWGLDRRRHPPVRGLNRRWELDKNGSEWECRSWPSSGIGSFEQRFQSPD
jgi:hypothetical protein